MFALHLPGSLNILVVAATSFMMSLPRLAIQDAEPSGAGTALVRKTMSLSSPFKFDHALTRPLQICNLRLIANL
jgi:hypothetical protein